MRRSVLLAALPVLLLAGCTPTVALTPAPDATSTACAGVIVRMPPAIGQAQQRFTDAQGTAAWGTPASVVLTCGVTVPGPSTVECGTVDGVDWLLENRRVDGSVRRVLTSYGRTPAVQVVVDTAEVSANDVLAALSEPVRVATTATGRACLAATATPTPSS